MIKKFLKPTGASTPLMQSYIRKNRRDVRESKVDCKSNPCLTYRNFSNRFKDRKFENGEVFGFIQVKNTTIYVVKGDLTNEDTDAIVNAANSHLAHGGGVAGAISRKGGRDFQKVSDEIVKMKGPIPTGSAVEQFAPPTFKCQYVIHAVGPIYDDGEHDEENLLSSCIERSLEIADRMDPSITSISFPAISSGIFGFPKDLCAEVFFATIINYIKSNDTNLRHIRLTNFDKPTVDVFENELKNVKKLYEKEDKIPEKK